MVDNIKLNQENKEIHNSVGSDISSDEDTNKAGSNL